MLKTPTPAQQHLEMVTLEMLVPKDHLLRKIDATVDFEFIRAQVAHLYCADNGRPALDPVVMFKLLFVGYLFGVRSERQLMREVAVNTAYRWFAGFRLTDKVPDASTFSQHRRRRYTDPAVYQSIFDAIVRQAMGHGLVGGRVLYTDSTHLKANANKKKFDAVQLEQTPSAYLAELDAAVDADRKAHGKKPLRRDDAPPAPKETKVNRTDPDSGYLMREGKPEGFFYLDHRTVDARHAIITDTHVTPANVHDSIVYLERLDRQRKRFDFNVSAVGLDAGYATSGIARGLEDRDILGVTGYRNPTPPKPGMMRKSKFVFEPEADGYRCPEGRLLTYATTDRNGYRHYRSDPASCTSNAASTRTITRHVWQDARERTDAHRLTPWGKAIYKRRKETVERSFADAKQLHGHRYARFRSLIRVACQCLMAAAAQNIKKIAIALTKAPIPSMA
jgi:transposase